MKSSTVKMWAFLLGVLSVIRFGVSYDLGDGKHAVVTLVSGSSSGYIAGAVALGQSLIDVGSELTRVVMVTPDVDQQSRKQMSRQWEVIEVDPIYCNHKHNLDPTQYDLSGDRYQAGLKRWSSTCTKFAAWKLTQFKRVIFMDADMLVVEPIDDALYGFSNASFLAAPETFPPDNFNSGFMVLEPSMKTFEKLLQLNEDVGSAEGGDQGVFNNGFCPNWQFVGPEDKDCGRLPWLFNVEAVHYEKYKTLRAMGGQRAPAVIHYVSDGKPWAVLVYEYVPNINIPDATKRELAQQAVAHLLWRRAYFRGSGEPPSDNRFLLNAVALLNAPPATNSEDSSNNKGGVKGSTPDSKGSKSKPFPAAKPSPASVGKKGKWTRRTAAAAAASNDYEEEAQQQEKGEKKKPTIAGKGKAASAASKSTKKSAKSRGSKKIKERLARAKRTKEAKAKKGGASAKSDL